jgi:hypothetical protein
MYIVFETESNWSCHNFGLVDYIKIKNKDFHPIITVCSSCGSTTQNPSSDHYFHEHGMVLCETCYLDFHLMNNN